MTGLGAAHEVAYYDIRFVSFFSNFLSFCLIFIIFRPEFPKEVIEKYPDYVNLARMVMFKIISHFQNLFSLMFECN